MTQRIERNGRPASTDDLKSPALVNYGHFTSMQARGHAVRGLALHLQRLEQGTQALFGCALDVPRVRGYLRQVLAGSDGDAALRVTVYVHDWQRIAPGTPVVPDVLVSAGPAMTPPPGPVTLQTVWHERVLPQVKHVGTFSLFHHRRQAQLAGVDDALFVDAAGRISEGTFWNIGFWDGHRVAWPNAPALHGVSQQLLQRGLRQLGIDCDSRALSLDELPAFAAAFTSNANAFARPVARINAQTFAGDPALMDTLRRAYESNPWEPL